MSDLSDKLDNLEEKIKEQEEVKAEALEQTEQAKTQLPQQTSTNVEDTINILANHEKLVKGKLGQDLLNKFQSGQFDKDIDETTNAIAQSAFTKERSKAEEKMGKATKSLDETYFDLHKEELESCGIKERTYMDRMQKAVQTNHNWWDVYFSLILWWACGINVFANNIAKWNSRVLKVIVWIFLALVLMVFVPIFIAIGLVRTLILVLCKSIMWFIGLFHVQRHKQKKEDKPEEKVTVVETETENGDNVDAESAVSYMPVEKQPKKNKKKEG